MTARVFLHSELRSDTLLDTGDARTLTWGEIEQRFANRRAQRDA